MISFLSCLSFRDRRYEYKGLNKVWKGKLSEAKSSGNPIKIQEAQNMVILYDSLQLAHKCILNSFYGYVMRKGARWYSMEMAGVVTYTGAKIIQNARLLVEKIGRPLELDTDGIWCALPGSFPENFTFKTKDSKRKLTISYPCVMLNVDVARNNTNDQYQTLKDPVNRTYATHSECSIEFEVDGPYKAMILPASKAEGILIKKRYAVFNDDGTLAELKGFEIKRRECYAAVANVANRWLDLLDNQGKDVADSELLDYISESSTMSKSLVDYGEQKSCAVTTAKRLADFLGDTMVKDKGLRCQHIVACEPKGTPVSDRAIPVAIFETENEIMKSYKQRLSSAIQKIITIPAAMQKATNPVPRVVHPDWLHKKVREKEDKFRQKKIKDLFSAKPDALEKDGAATSGAIHGGNNIHNMNDLEDFGNSDGTGFGKFQNVASVEEVDRTVDYAGWLEQKKRKWKDNREKRKRQRLCDAKTSKQGSGASELRECVKNKRKNIGRSGVSSYFKRQELSLTSSYWQIVCLRFPISVPRVFYLNSRATEEFPGRRVNKILPHGRPSYNLIEIIIDELKFREESKRLMAHLADPEVEVDYVVENHEAERIMQKTISEHRPQTSRPCIAVTECPSIHLLKAGIQVLNDLPCVSIPANARDSQYPAVGWQTVAAKIALQRCAASSQ
ncbi:hypothetical protein KSS87_011324 [Heliosperma pusillum]|nr:hypothetical protein KSS87_002738 [Heliosperma pusillum]KAH9625306.1 hypothetical protein KSS87_011324 [Heliosperma pusillum]